MRWTSSRSTPKRAMASRSMRIVRAGEAADFTTPTSAAPGTALMATRARSAASASVPRSSPRIFRATWPNWPETFSLTLSRMGIEKLRSMPGISPRLALISAMMSSGVVICGRHASRLASRAKISRLLGSVGSVPSSGRPSCVMISPTSGVRATMALSCGAMRRPSLSEMLSGNVTVM